MLSTFARRLSSGFYPRRRRRLSELEIKARKSVKRLCSREPARGFQVLLEKQTPQWLVMVYSAREGVSGHLLLGCAVASAGRGGYHCGFIGWVDQWHDSEWLVDFQHMSNDRDYALVYGRVLDPRVDRVEVEFDDGQILRERPTDGAYAAFAVGAGVGLELRVIGVDGEVLQRVEPRYPPADLRLRL